MKIELVALDLDGTLLNNAHEITQETIDIIEALKEKNIKVVIATGRTFTAAKRYHNLLKLNTPLISCNGGFIYKPDTDEIIDEHPIEKTTLEETFDILENEEIFYQFYTRKTIYSKEIKYLLENWIHQNKQLDSEDRINIELVAHPSEVLSKKKEIFKLLIIEENKDIWNKIYQQMKKFDDLELVSSFEGALDIMVKNVTKAQGLQKVCDYYNIPIENTLAIGDNNNDAEMLKTAKIGIAVENATTIAKNAADYITASNEENGVLKALKRYL